ncbi:MAG: hypothetical protein ACT4N2_11725 [Hyphomicrobium sp.]
MTLDRQIGSYANYTGRIFRGSRQPSISDAILLAKNLQVPLSLILRKLGYDLADSTLKAIGRVNEFGRVSFLPPNLQSQVPAPGATEPGTVALIVEASNTPLAMYDGEVFYYAPSTVIRPDAIGRLSVIEMDDMSAPVIGVLDRARVGRGRVVVFGINEVVESERLISATPIRWRYSS